MFIFYDLEYISGLRSVHQLASILEDGYKILVPSLQCDCYGKTGTIIRKCAEDNLVEIIDIDNFDVFLQNNKPNGYAKPFLYLLHCCIETSAFFVVDKSQEQLVNYANSLGVNTMSIEEFTKDIIKNEIYIEFLINIKDDLIKIKS